MRYGSVCSGIEAATSAWHPLGWKPVWFSEIEPFPSRLLAHHYPHVPNLGDMTKLAEKDTFTDESIDLLVGGTPCQSFSVAGLRLGLDDDRGNLALEFVRLLMRKRPTWFVWENVPGVLSSSNGADFAAILSAWTGKDIAPQRFASAGIIEGTADGYSVAWRILDAQYLGVPQRRRRVFVVGHIGNDWRPPTAVLFERDSLRGSAAPVRGKRQKATGSAATRADLADAEVGPFWNGEQICQTLDVGINKGLMPEKNRFAYVVVPHVFKVRGGCEGGGKGYLGQNEQAFTVATGQDQNVLTAVRLANTPSNGHGISEGDPAYTLDTACKSGRAMCYDTTNISSPVNGSNPKPGAPCHTLAKGQHPPLAVIPINTMNVQGRPSDTGRMGLGIGEPGDPQHTLSKSHSHAVAYESVVRRLTPMECERLQGFPDKHTDVPGASDTARYKAIGNSMAVPVMRWIGRRIDAVDKLKFLA